jgi:hypothetical protein
VSRRTLDLLLALASCTVVLLFLGSAIVPESVVYRAPNMHAFLMYVGGLSKLSALAIGGMAALHVSRTFAAGNPSRFAWRCMAGWLLAWTSGQATLIVYQWLLRERLPFPSAADPLFVIGSALMVVGFVAVLRAYVSSGFAFGNARGLWLLAAVVSAMSVIVGTWTLKPIAEASGTPLERVLNLAYPVCDLIALIPVALLMRMTLALRGGALFRVWSFLLAGFLALVVADVLYAYITMLDQHWTRPADDLAFIVGYGLVARGMVEQRRLTA